MDTTRNTEEKGDVMKKTVTNTTTEAERNPARVLLAAMAHPNDAIERSEARGQQEFIESDVLPQKLSEGSTVEDFEALGFEFHGPVPDDDLFQYVTLPDGWSRKGSDHNMWSSIVDEHGVERVAVFYKAAFYDRSAAAHIMEDEHAKTRS